MKPRTLILAFLALVIIGAAVTIYFLRNQEGVYEQPDAPPAFDHTHAAFDRILNAHVSAGKVDYAKIKASPRDLDTFLDDAAAVKESAFDTWTKDQQLAFLIDLYNATTIRLVIDHYPLASIKDIGNAVVTAWKKPVVRLFGKLKSLDYLEHDLIRTAFDDPRIHFALVCAAVSCPPLRSEAFTSDNLDAQLDDQGRIFLANTTKNRVSQETNTVHLSKIFDWYGVDFTKDGVPIHKALAPWFPEPLQNWLQNATPEIQFNDYDWSLNE